jgi:murein DD-endopeptidase MepM/ murein hydrolase activator NlpD
MTELPQATSRRELRERERQSAPRPRPLRLGSTATTAPPVGVSRARRRTIGSRLLSLGAMVFVAALAVGLSIPANLFGAPATASAASGSVAGAASAALIDNATGTQSAAVSPAETVDAGTRDGFQVLSWAQVLASKYKTIDNYKYSGGSGSVRWPFPYQVSISSGFGPRIAPCNGCSTFHEGVDFTPGEGAAIFAIADGVVTGREDGTGSYGNFVKITHQINGHTVISTYAHMLRGSSPIVLGQTVKVGDFLGLVGMTGEATGPHLHFEVNVDGTTVDPIPWLEANVN